MKLTILLALAALLAGTALGAGWRRGRADGERQASPAEGAKTVVREAVPIESAPARAPGSLPDAPDPVKSNPGNPKERFATLVEKKNGVGILALVRELETGGPEGYAALSEILEWLLKLDKCEDYGLDDQDAESVLSSARLRPFSAWGIRRPGELSVKLRMYLALDLLSGDDGDDNHLALELLSAEADPEFCLGIEWCLSKPSEAEVPAFLQAIQAHLHQPEIARSLMVQLASTPTPDAISFLEGLSASADPNIASWAKVALRSAVPPVAGVLIMDGNGGDCGLQLGDIVTSWNGEPLPDIKTFWDASAKARDSGATVIVEIEREGHLEKIEVKSPPGLGAQFVKPGGSR